MKFIMKKWWLWVGILVILIASAAVYLYFNRASADVVNPGIIAGDVSVTSIDLSQNQKVDLKFVLAQKLYVKVYVLGANGTTIKKIWRSENAIAPGTYDKTKYSALVWDGTNDKGQKVAAGRYTVLFDGRNKARLVARDINPISVTTVPASKVTVTPASFDPALGKAGVTVAVSKAASYRMVVKDSSSNIVKTMANFANVNPGSYNFSWDGKNDSGQIVSSGDYLVANEIKLADATTAISGSAKVAVLTTAPPPPTPPAPAPPTVINNELGNTIEGVFSANFDWFKMDDKFGITFTPEKSGQLGGINVQWKSGSSYGYNAPGTPSPHTVTSAKNEHGVYRFEIQESGADGYPSGTVLTSTENIYPEDALALASGRVISSPNTEQCTCDGSLQVNFANKAALTAGKVYHVVITNTAANKSTNYSSVNTLASRILTGTSIGGNNRGEYWNRSIWQPWTTTDADNFFQPSTRSNNLDGSHVPVLLRWADGTFSGDPYYSAASQSRHPALYGSNSMGEKIVWAGTGTVINKIGLPVYREGAASPAGDLLYHIDLPNGATLTGTIAKASDVTAAPKWFYADITPFSLENGKTYKLWFNSPGSTSNGYYSQTPPYGQGTPGVWLEKGWGGTASRATVNAAEYADMDLSFSLQKAS
jgi:flagellar hook assembly protein FlgD